MPDHAGCIDTRKELLEDSVPRLSTWRYLQVVISNVDEDTHSRTKHIHTRYHFIKEQVENRFQYLVRRIGMRCLTPAELEVLANEYA
ncbi:hypothetical protein Tco_0564455 [Tanacetum coccineum]